MRHLILGLMVSVLAGCDRNAATPGGPEGRSPTAPSAPSSNNLPRGNVGGEAQPVEPTRSPSGNAVSQPAPEPRSPVTPK